MTARLLLVCTLGLVFWPLCFSLKDDVSINEISKEVSLHEEEERIVGGQNSRQGQFYWMAALYYRGEMTCSCSIISPMTVLTAAHCIIIDNQQAPASDFYAIVGNMNRSAPETIVTFSSVTPNPDFDPENLQSDVAFMTASSPMMFSNNVGKICIAAGPGGPDQYKFNTATAMGWGYTTKGTNQIEGTLPHILQYVDLLILAIDKCRVRYKGSVTHTNICGDGFGTGICQGDSGGPFVWKSRTSNPLQIGVASFISQEKGCGSIILKPSVFAFVPSFANWILNASNDTKICTVPLKAP